MAQQIREMMQKLARSASAGGPSQPSGRGGAELGAALGSVVVGGGLLYGAYHSFFSVDGGHRAVIFNRILGMKETVYN
ncbi:MAG: hypothetical protein ACREOZ_02910, partial [Gloeomargaritales cyanobacterium]